MCDLCAGCPVIDQCLELDLRTAVARTTSVWAPEDDRRALHQIWRRRRQQHWPGRRGVVSQHVGLVHGADLVADLGKGNRVVRDSKNLTGPTLMVTAAEWIAFTAGVCADEFN